MSRKCRYLPGLPRCSSESRRLGDLGFGSVPSVSAEAPSAVVLGGDRRRLGADRERLGATETPGREPSVRRIGVPSVRLGAGGAMAPA